MEADAGIAAEKQSELHQLLRQWRRRDAEQPQPMKTMQAQQWAGLTSSRQKPRHPRNEAYFHNRLKSVMFIHERTDCNNVALFISRYSTTVCIVSSSKVMVS